MIRTDDLIGLYRDEDVDTTATITVEPIIDSVLSRLGGDEFIVLLPDTRDRFAAGTVARRILAHLEQPIRVEGHEVFVSASIGIATYPEDGLSSEILIRNADTAMYHAKQQGKAAFQYYSAAMNAASVERLTLETGLRRALEDDSLELHYQPQVDVRTGRIIGAEALLRWHNPQRGYISPASFIPIAEDSGSSCRSASGFSSARARRQRRGSAGIAADPDRRERLGRAVPTPGLSAGSCSASSPPIGSIRRCCISRSRRPPSSRRASARSRCSISCARSACGSRSTTSAPATRR